MKIVLVSVFYRWSDLSFYGGVGSCCCCCRFSSKRRVSLPRLLSGALLSRPLFRDYDKRLEAQAIGSLVEIGWSLRRPAESDERAAHWPSTSENTTVTVCIARSADRGNKRDTGCRGALRAPTARATTIVHSKVTHHGFIFPKLRRGRRDHPRLHQRKITSPVQSHRPLGPHRHPHLEIVGRHLRNNSFDGKQAGRNGMPPM